MVRVLSKYVRLLLILHNGVEIEVLVKFFVSGIVYCTNVRYKTVQNLNKSLYEECMKYGFCFIDNGVVSERDLWKDGIHLIESGRVIVANNLINYLNNFLRPMNHPIWGQI